MYRRGISLFYGFLPLYFICWFFLGLHLTFLVVVTTLSALYFFHIPPAAEESKARLFLRGRNDLVIAHRGGAYQAPENTLAAIRMAKDNGADGVELDVKFTKDGVAVVLHDASVDRTTNGTGLVGSMTYQEVATLDAAARHPLRSMFPLQRIPTLETAVALCLELDLLIFFDCKGQAEKTSVTLANLFEKYPKLYEKSVVCCFYPEVLYAVRKRNAYVVTALTYRHNVLSKNMNGSERNKELWKQLVSPFADWILEWSHYTFLWYLCGNNFFLLYKDTGCSQILQFWKRRNIDVILWTLNTPLEKQYFLKQLSCSILTDTMDPDYNED